MRFGIRRSVSLTSLGLLLSLTLAACGTVKEDVPPTVTRVDAPNAPATYTATLPGASPVATTAPAASPTVASGGGDTGGGGAPAATEIDMVELAFQPNAVEIPANTDVTLTIKDSGALAHEFKIDDQNIDSGLLNPGETKDVVVNLPPGTYTYHCPVPGHTEAGMVGTLTVK